MLRILPLADDLILPQASQEIYFFTESARSSHSRPCSDHFAHQPRRPKKADEETGSVSKSGVMQESLNRCLGMWRISA